jgi:membrane-associated phospholipid phosphatase
MRGKTRSFKAPSSLLFSPFVFISSFADTPLVCSLPRPPGLDVIIWIQQFRSTVTDRLVKTFSQLGFEFVVPAVPFLVWHGGKSSRMHSLGLDIVSMLMYTLCSMSLLKMYFQEKRPLWHEHDSIGQATGAASSGEREFSFPSGHAWATCVYWLLVTERFRDYFWLSYLAVAAVLFCSFSRVWFAMHYPHDVIVGISLGALYYVWRRWFLVFCPEKRKRHEVGQFVVWLLVTVIGFSSLFEYEHRKNQKGLTFGEGCLVMMFLLRHRVQRVLDLPPPGQTWTKKRILFRRVARLLLGLIPVVIWLRIAETYVAPRVGELDIFVGGFTGAASMLSTVSVAASEHPKNGTQAGGTPSATTRRSPSARSMLSVPSSLWYVNSKEKRSFPSSPTRGASSWPRARNAPWTHTPWPRDQNHPCP